MPSEIVRDAYDVIIVGGGPAGLSAALVLGRCRRKVLVCDAGAPRNAASSAVHGFLTRDGIPPAELLRLGREQLRPYGVKFRRMAISKVRRHGDRFVVTNSEGKRFTSGALLLATGLKDRLPNIEGLDRFYGRSVFHCPYCDGWEMRNKPLCAYGKGSGGAALALSLKTWSDDVVLCTDGLAKLSPLDRRRLESSGIPVVTGRIARLEGAGSVLRRIIFQKGDALERRGIFFSTGHDQHCDLPGNLGCQFSHKGEVRTDRLQCTGVPGLYVAGDASEDVEFAIVAAAEGAKAGVAINKLLQEQQAPVKLLR